MFSALDSDSLKIPVSAQKWIWINKTGIIRYKDIYVIFSLKREALKTK